MAAAKKAFQRSDLQSFLVGSPGSQYRVTAPKDVKLEIGQVVYLTASSNKLDQPSATITGFRIASLDGTAIVDGNPAYKYVGTAEEIGGKALAREQHEAKLAAATKVLDAALERETFSTKFERAKAFLSKEELALIESVIEKV